jgi:cellobiose phosphorylase
LADTMMGRADQAWRGMEKILPFSADRKTVWGEPYVMANCYFGPAAGYRYDRPGQSWMTATTGWFLRILVQRLFGLQPTIEGLRVVPSLPASWSSCAITRSFRGTLYRISYSRTGRSGVGILVDKQPLAGDLLPLETGRTYDVEVLLPLATPTENMPPERSTP